MHQILQWDHLLSGLAGPAGSDLRFQIMADGRFHLFMYVLAVTGAVLLVPPGLPARVQGGRPRSCGSPWSGSASGSGPASGMCGFRCVPLAAGPAPDQDEQRHTARMGYCVTGHLRHRALGVGAGAAEPRRTGTRCFGGADLHRPACRIVSGGRTALQRRGQSHPRLSGRHGTGGDDAGHSSRRPESQMDRPPAWSAYAVDVSAQ
nr:DUF2243 domain-containing protein [Mesorhizobium sp. LNHC220B00]